MIVLLHVVITEYMYVSSVSIYRCSLCGRRCPSKIALKSHLKCHDSEGGGFPAKCDICDRMFSRKHLMERHKLHKHTNHQSEYRCTECNKVFGHQSKSSDLVNDLILYSVTSLNQTSFVIRSYEGISV